MPRPGPSRQSRSRAVAGLVAVGFLVLLAFAAGRHLGREAQGDAPPNGPAAPPPPPAPAELLDAAGLRYVATATGYVSWPSPLQPEGAWSRASRALVAAGARRLEDGWELAGRRIVAPAAGWLVLVIDDIGFRPQRVRRMLAWGQPVIFAVLPGRPHSRTLAAEIRAAGRTLFLHMPMEPEGYPRTNPGAHALLLADGPERWRAELDAAAKLVPGIVGINNHMGSRFTTDARAMATVAAWLAERRLVFLDSLTTPHSAARAACRAAGVPYVARDVFLDHERSASFLDQQIALWFRLARRRGIAVAIGHPHEVTLDRLEAALTTLPADLRIVDWPLWSSLLGARGRGA